MSTKSIPLTSYQIRLLAVLALINFVNFAARQVFVPLIPLLRDHLYVTDAELGSLQTFLLVVLAAGSVPFGFFADRFSRKAIIAFGMLLGGAAGHALGGIIGPRYGWQEALFIVAFAGIVPGIALFWIAEPPRGPRSEVVPIARLLRVPAFVSMIFAGICITFSSVSLLTWGTDFAVSYKDFSLRQASVSLAVIALVSAVLHDMMPRRAHATCVGVYMFATQLFGGLGPHVVGKISDLHDLQLGLQIAVAVMVCGALLMLLVIHFIRRDGLRHPTLAAFHAEPGD